MNSLTHWIHKIDITSIKYMSSDPAYIDIIQISNKYFPDSYLRWTDTAFL